MEYYDILAPGYDELHRTEQLGKLKLIKANLEIKENERLLDVGCGTGLSKEVFECRIAGIEPSREMLRETKIFQKETRLSQNDTDLVQGIAELLPLKDQVFEAVICVTALHNFKDPKKALEEMKRVGKGMGAITILKKAKCAKELQSLAHELFEIEKIIDGDKDIILIFKPRLP